MEKTQKNDIDVQEQELVVTKKKIQIKEPPMYRVILHNDDYTPMDFVVAVLEKYFHKSSKIANKIMLDIHNLGSGICGSFTYEVAETKVAQVTEFSRENEHLLRCTMEKTPHD